MKRFERERARLLRSEGHSLKEISSMLGVSKSSASLWVRDVMLSRDAEMRINAAYSNGQIASQKALRERTAKRIGEARSIAATILDSTDITREMALILCATMYWCEGAKARNDNAFRFSNSDPAMIRAYLALLRKAIPIEEHRLRALVHLHEYHDERTELLFWSELTKIPLCRFNKTYWKPHTGKRLKEGTEAACM
jgi:hypothetical protein